MAPRLKDNVFAPSGRWFAKGTLRSEMDGEEASTIGEHAWEDTDGATDDVQEVPDSTPVDTSTDGPLDPAIPPEQNPDAAPAAESVVVAPVVKPLPAPVVEIPPKGGPGSGKDAWLAYAHSVDVKPGPGANRDDIIRDIEDAGHPTQATKAD